VRSGNETEFTYWLIYPGGIAMISCKSCVWSTACVFCLAVLPLSASAVDCLSYLSAERSFQKEAGEAPNHRTIEAALSGLPAPTTPLNGDPWQKYLDALNRLAWARESQDRLHKEHDRQNLLGGEVPNYRIKSSVAHKGLLEALDALRTAAKRLDDWLAPHGISEHAAQLFRWFVSSYQETHEISGSRAPDLMFRVAVHERRTMCPP